METPFLGLSVRDIVTGLEGIAVSATLYLNGCLHYCIQKRGADKDGKPFELEWVDAQQIQVMSEKSIFEEWPNAGQKSGAEPTGGPHKEPSKSAWADPPPRD